MRTPQIDVGIFKERRKRLAAVMKDGALILPAPPEQIRNHDVHVPYRQDSNLFYLTGFEEPESVLVFRPGQTPETTLFVRPKDITREIWDGFRYGPEATRDLFQVDATYLIDDFEKQITELLKPVGRVFYKMYRHSEFDSTMASCLEKVRAAKGRSGMGLLPVLDPTEMIGEMRLLKTREEVEWQAKACEISARAHINAMKFCRPGVNERQLQAVLAYSFLNEMSPRVGYSSIVATGANATTLHYIYNDQVCQDGQMLLIDAGTEWNYYSGDITRTFPVNGRFSKIQGEVYQAVLEVQKKLVEFVQPGLAYKELQTKAVELLTDVMFEFGLLVGDKSKAIADLEYKRYYPHNVSHWLGMDVHDAGLYMLGDQSRKLEAGMVLTIEPGLYVREDETRAPKEFRGLGIRIEDDILVTPTGRQNLTISCPKEVADIESIVGKGFQI